MILSYYIKFTIVYFVATQRNYWNVWNFNWPLNSHTTKIKEIGKVNEIINQFLLLPDSKIKISRFFLLGYFIKSASSNRAFKSTFVLKQIIHFAIYKIVIVNRVEQVKLKKEKKTTTSQLEFIIITFWESKTSQIPCRFQLS